MNFLDGKEVVPMGLNLDRLFRVITVASLLLTTLPVSSVNIVSAENTSTQIGEVNTNITLKPRLLNQATGELFDPNVIRYQPEIYLNDVFGTGKNIAISSSINFFDTKNVNLPDVPDAYQFKKIVVTSDKDAAGKTYTREIDQVIKLGDSYFARIKGTIQDYLKFTNQNQITIVYNRFLRIGFKTGVESSPYLMADGTNQILAGIQGILPTEKQNGISSEKERNGFSIYNANFADNRLYYLPDFKTIQFARPGFDEISQKSGSTESNTALSTTENFFEYLDQSQAIFAENINNYGTMIQKNDRNIITYDYFVKNSGYILLDNNIPAEQTNQTNQFKLHFPASKDNLARTTVFKDDISAVDAIVGGNARVTWTYIYHTQVNPAYSGTVINGKQYWNDYPISKGGTVVFTLAPSDFTPQTNSYHSHLNKLIINGQSINLPPSELRPSANVNITQKYSRTAYTYLKTGELIAVSYVPLPDGYTPTLQPWTIRDKKGTPYYYVTVMNIQGDISMYGNGEKRSASDGGATPIGPDISFVRDGSSFMYGSGWLGRQAPISYNKDGLKVRDDDDVSTLLSTDHDLDIDSAVIYSGRSTSGKYNIKQFPQGYFYDGSKTNGLGMNKSRRLVVDSSHPLMYKIKRGSKTDNDIKINSNGPDFRGRYYNVQSAYSVEKEGNPTTGYISDFKDSLYWIDFKREEDGGQDYGSTIYHVDLINKHFKTFAIRFRGLNDEILHDKSINHLVFPRSNVSLTSSINIDDFGHVTPLAGSTKKIGTTADTQLPVTESDESGFITIPALPEGATFYELVSVSQNGTQIPLTHKKFLPGQKVFTGQFLPEGTDFGQANGIDNGAIVTLKAVKVTPYEPKAETTLAESAVDIHVYDEVNRGLYVGDEVLADHFVTDLGEESPLKEGAYQLYNAQNGLADVSKTGAWSTYRLTRATVGTDKIYTMKNFGDSSYEITSTLATIREKQPSNLTVENQTVVDPLSQDSNGALPTAAKLAWSTTADATVTLQKEIDWPGVEVGISHPVKETAQVDSVKIPINEWQEKANNDSDSLQIPFTAQATGVDHRKQPLTAIRQQTSTHTVSSPANLLETRLLRNRDLSGASRLSTLANTEDEATAEEPTVANGPKLVTLTVTKAMSPTPTAKGVDGENVVTVTFAKQSEILASFGTDDKSSSYVQVLQGGQQLNVTRTDLVDEGNQYRLSVTLDKPLQKAEQLTVKYRYNARYQSVDAAFTVDASWRDISNTGLKLICSPFLWVLVLTGGAVGVARYRKMKMK